MKVELDVFGTKHTTYLSPDGIEKSDLDTRLSSNPDVESFLNRMASEWTRDGVVGPDYPGPELGCKQKASRFRPRSLRRIG